MDRVPKRCNYFVIKSSMHFFSYSLTSNNFFWKITWKYYKMIEVFFLGILTPKQMAAAPYPVRPARPWPYLDFEK